jgi:hypothetical protein
MKKWLIAIIIAYIPIAITFAQPDYPIHQNITTTVFWVGEEASSDNAFIENKQSSWDDRWAYHFGGFDDPKNRNGYLPANFTPKENPFYFALPYDDFDDEGDRKSDVYDTVYWSDQKAWSPQESMLKNHWIKITKEDKTCYAQWEDAGPFYSDDADYVFGTEPPKNEANNNAGLDVSPAVADCLNLYKNNQNTVSWQFVGFDQVPDGPWKVIITKPQRSLTASFLSPLEQSKLGVLAENVKCKQGLELVIKTKNHLPLCVTSHSKSRLIVVGLVLPS